MSWNGESRMEAERRRPMPQADDSEGGWNPAAETVQEYFARIGFKPYKPPEAK